MSRQEEREMLKRFQSAVQGHPMSGTTCSQVNKVLGTNYYGESIGPRLTIEERAKLQRLIDDMAFRGIKPAKSLLTPCQKRSLARNKRCRA